MYSDLFGHMHHLIVFVACTFTFFPLWVKAVRHMLQQSLICQNL